MRGRVLDAAPRYARRSEAPGFGASDESSTSGCRGRFAIPVGTLLGLTYCNFAGESTNVATLSWTKEDRMRIEPPRKPVDMVVNRLSIRLFDTTS